MIKAVFYLLENVIPVIRAVVSKGHIGLTTEKMKICWKISMGGYFGGEYSEEKLLKHLSEQQITVFSGIEGVIWK